MKIVLYLLFLWTLTACTSKSINSDPHNLDNTLVTNEWTQENHACVNIPINPNDQQPLILSQASRHTQFIKLETPMNGALALSSNIISFENRFYISDFSKSNTVYVFDWNGTFLFTIGNTGRGPGEYLTLKNFWIDPKEKQVIIWDVDLHKVIFFDLEGNFRKETSFPFYAREYAILDEETHMFYLGSKQNPPELGNLNYKLIITNSQGLVRSQHFPKDKHIDINTHFYLNQDGFNLTHSFDDTIYQITSNQLQAKYVIDFGENKLPDNYIFDRPEVKFSAWQKEDVAFLISNVSETSSHLYFTFHYKGKMKYVLYSKASKNKFISDKFYDDIYGGLILHKLFRWDNKMIASIDAHDLLDKYNKLKKSMTDSEWIKFSGNHQDYISIVKTTTESDNPILMIMTLEEF